MVIVDGECVRALYETGCFLSKMIIGEFLCRSQTWLPLSQHLPMLSQQMETLWREKKQDDIHVALASD